MKDYYRQLFIRYTGVTPEEWFTASDDIDGDTRKFVENYEENQERAWIAHEWRTI